MSIASLQAKHNKVMANRSGLGRTCITLSPALTPEQKAYRGYDADKATDYYIAKSRGYVSRPHFPGKDVF